MIDVARELIIGKGHIHENMDNRTLIQFYEKNIWHCLERIIDHQDKNKNDDNDVRRKSIRK